MLSQASNYLKKPMRDLWVTFIFMEFQILEKTKFANKQILLQNKKESRHEFCEPGYFLSNKIQFFMCKIETVVPTSCGSSEN